MTILPHNRPDDESQVTYLRVARPHAPEPSVALSLAALHLHTFAMLSSLAADCTDADGYVCDGYVCEGFVSDTYLGAIKAETSIAALELCLAGLWTRTDGGYRVAESDVRQVRGRVRAQLLDLAGRCRREGGHVIGSAHPEFCARCGTPSPGVGQVH